MRCTAATPRRHASLHRRARTPPCTHPLSEFWRAVLRHPALPTQTHETHMARDILSLTSLLLLAVCCSTWQRSCAVPTAADDAAAIVTTITGAHHELLQPARAGVGGFPRLQDLRHEHLAPARHRHPQPMDGMALPVHAQCSCSFPHRVHCTVLVLCTGTVTGRSAENRRASPMKNTYEVHIPGILVPIENPIGYLRWPTKIWVLGRRA